MENEILHKPKTGPKDFFLYLAAMITLYMTVGSLIRLVFGIIDFTNPDQLNYYSSFYTGGIRFAIASLVIIFPVYLIISWILRKSIIKDQARSELWVRKWFIYITLFVAGGIVIGDFVAVVNQFLGGEITARFILKMLSMAVISLAVLGYYWYDLKRASRNDSRSQPMFIVISSLIVLAAIVGGFMVAGSPTSQRELRFDETRVSDLQSIQWQIVDYWQNKRVLPTELSFLEDNIRGYSVPRDPETKNEYGYILSGAETFELCATFTLPSPPNRGDLQKPSRVYEFGVSENWDHESGEVCFERTIDPDFFPKPVR